MYPLIGIRRHRRIIYYHNKGGTDSLLCMYVHCGRARNPQSEGAAAETAAVYMPLQDHKNGICSDRVPIQNADTWICAGTVQIRCVIKSGIAAVVPAVRQICRAENPNAPADRRQSCGCRQKEVCCHE